MIRPEDKTVATVSFRARKAIIEKLQAIATDNHCSTGTAAKMAMENYFQILEEINKKAKKD